MILIIFIYAVMGIGAIVAFVRWWKWAWDHAPKRGSEGLKGVLGFLYQTSLACTTESGPPWLGTGMHEVDVWLLVLIQLGCIVTLFGCLVACEHLKLRCRWSLFW